MRALRRDGEKVSFNAWLIKSISKTLEQHQEVASYLQGRRKIIIFNSINVSFLVEKVLEGKRVPLPLVIENANEKSITEITAEIDRVKERDLEDQDIVLNRKTQRMEKIYYHLPGFLRKIFWRFLLSHPQFAYDKMGNVAITSLGMIGRINGWFIHRSIHPVSFGIGSVIKKPVVNKDRIEIRDILNMTVLLDHDVTDGAPMVRFLTDLTTCIEKGTVFEVII